MASALQLNAVNSIINGRGLGTSPALITQVTAFQNLASVQYVNGIFTSVGATGANIKANLYPILNTLTSTALYGQWLLDFYPSASTPISNGGVVLYGNVTATASFSQTLLSQANVSFSNGISGFSNAYSTCSGYALSNLDTVASANILVNKTYAQSGLGYTGPADLATNGIGASGAILANVVANWGTMYDISNIRTFGDPYVFGQNLINQGLGAIGNLSTQFTNAGLDLTDLTAAPAAATTTTHNESTISSSTAIGVVELQTLAPSTTVGSSAGSSPSVMTAIFQSVTGANLTAIVNATQITVNNSQITNLGDYLNFDKVISRNLSYQLRQLGITDFATLGAYLQKLVGKGSFTSWSQMAKFFNSIVVPNFSTTQVSDPNAPVVSSSVASSLTANLPTGSGQLGNPIMIDFFGATAGIPYTANLQTLVSGYGNVSSTVESALSTLSSAVTNYITAFNASSYPTTSAVTSAVNAVNTALGQLGNTSAVWATQTAYVNMINRLTTEVNNQTAARAGFGTVTSQGLSGFAQNVTNLATDSSLANSKQIFDNIITNDSYGDTIRAAVAEKLNATILASVGLSNNNDPNPVQALTQSQQQNVPLTTYITQNQ
jgi:hypothetical protein